MIRKSIAFLTLAILCIVGLGGVARADVNDFVVRSFYADYVIDNQAVGGSLHATETIDLTFTDQNHGILRAIPKKYQGFKTKLNIQAVERDGAKEPFSTYTENNNLVLKIGDENKTITGKHRYVIEYTQERIINFSNKTQTFYWDINGTDWQQSFENVEARVQVKNQVARPSNNVLNSKCFTGRQGSQETACTMKEEGNGAVVYKTNRSLNPGENLSIEFELSGLSFAQPTLKHKILDHLDLLLGLALGLIFALSAITVWARVGRDHKGRSVVVPEYEAPKDLSPAEIGMLADFRVDGRDVSATLVDLAVKGYIRIHQDVKKILLFTSQSFTLELLNNDTTGLKEHEAELLNALFPALAIGEMLPLNSINRVRMQTAMKHIRDDMKTSLVDTYGLIEPSSLKAQAWMIGIGVVVALCGFAFVEFYPPAAIALILGGAAYFVLGFFAQSRSHAGVETYEKIKGLELYMNTAEKDRLKMLQSVDRPFAEPAKTVELFEKLLPFAIALGVEKSWAKQFDSILTEAPDWYSGNVGTFKSSVLASSLGSATTTFSKSFEASSGSGSSGGGSGGGGGGGGGGGW